LEGLVAEKRAGDLDRVKEIVSLFESFRDEGMLEGKGEVSFLVCVLVLVGSRPFHLSKVPWN